MTNVVDLNPTGFVFCNSRKFLAPIEMKILFCKKRLQWKAGNGSLKNN
jgi:hypothetical protein